MNELGLFAGAGGGLLASQHLLGFKTVCYVELDAYCVEILKQRISEDYLHDAPIWDDIRTFDGTPWSGSVDLITAGFPCQPFSIAGKQRGGQDERNLWPDTIRVICEVRPQYVFLENVPHLLSGSHGYFGTILSDLSKNGYDARWCVLSAADAGAPHLRKRLWVLAYSTSRQRNSRPEEQAIVFAADGTKARCDIGRSGDSWQTVANTKGTGLWGIDEQGIRQQAIRRSQTVADPAQLHINGGSDQRETFKPQVQELGNRSRPNTMAKTDEQGSQGYRGRGSEGECPCQFTPWACCRTHEDERLARSGVRRISDGVPKRVVKLRAAGNAQVPLVAAQAWKILSEELRQGGKECDQKKEKNGYNMPESAQK